MRAFVLLRLENSMDFSITPTGSYGTGERDHTIR